MTRSKRPLRLPPRSPRNTNEETRYARYLAYDRREETSVERNLRDIIVRSIDELQGRDAPAGEDLHRSKAYELVVIENCWLSRNVR